MKHVLITTLFLGSLLIAGHAGDAPPTQAKNAPKEAAATQTAARHSLEDKFRLALIEEETSQHLDSVIQAYKEVIAGLDDQRKMSVTAIFHLGECYRKQGKTNEALAQYERILRDFSEQKQVLDFARRRLAEMAPGKSGKEIAQMPGQPVPKIFDPEQVKMIREEIKLVETQLLTIQKKIENGMAPTDELYKPQRDLFTLKRLLPENAEAANQKSLLEQQLKLVEMSLQEMRNKIQVGAAPPLDAIPIERELLGLKRELMAVSQAAPDTANAPEVDAATPEEAAEIQKLKAIVKDSPDLINAKDADGKIPLGKAAASGHLAAVKYLIANGANIGAKYAWNRTALHAASEGGHKSVVEFLLSQGADVNAKDYDGATPLFLAVDKAFKSVIEVLMANKADVDSSGCIYPLSTRDANSPIRRYTPLYISCLHGHLDVARLLLAGKADPNATNSTGETPIFAPFRQAYDRKDWENKFLEVIELLCRNKADININIKKNDGLFCDGGTPLHYAAQYNPKAAELLISNGAHVNATDENSYTPLHNAANRIDAESARCLLAHGAEVNAKNKTGDTPLHLAIRMNNIRMVELLLQNKADVNMPDQSGLTPLAMTKSVEVYNPINRSYALKASPELEALLRQHGAADMPGSTAAPDEKIATPGQTNENQTANSNANSENRWFYIGGEVKTSGRLAYTGKLSVLEAIITAGGFTDFANRRKVQLVRAKDGSTVTLDCNKARGNPELDLPVNPGDKIIVPRNVF